MKQATIVTAVVLAAVGSWAFYPKAAVAPLYLMLIRDTEYTGSAQPRPALTIINPDGSFTTEELPVIESRFPRKVVNAATTNKSVDSTSARLRRSRYARNFVFRAEVRKLNELSTQGWTLVSTVQEGSAARYLLRKE